MTIDNFFSLVCFLGCVSMVESGTVSPYPFPLDNQYAGSNTTLFYHGSSPLDSLVTDADGYTVIYDKNSSDFIYAMSDNTSGELVSSGIIIGEGGPMNARIPKRLRSSSHKDAPRRHLLEGHHPHHRKLAVPATGTLKHLVILVRFKNHKNRILPTVDDFDILFNHGGENGTHHHLAPTGSVRDVFRINSYGRLTLNTTVYGWVDLPETEAYYAAGVGGFATPEFIEVLHSAMNALQNDFHIIQFSEFDSNNDGKIDMVTLIHSGFASEVNGDDEDGAVRNDRIWSHHRRLPRKHRWYPNRQGDAFAYQYATAPALYGAGGTSIGRIGVICHELGHAIGLPDLYGTSEGNGIGSYDFMSNHWGFPPYFYISQLYPPILSPWTKMEAGWVEPIVIDKSGTFTIEASQLSNQIYRINMDDEGIEYLLIENRQAIGFDAYLPQGGLAIWHVDENAANVEGYPGQEGIQWPLNKKHYKVALLQADGNYDLEHKRNHGDRFDLFHGDAVDFLAPSINFIEGPYPSTDSYKNTMPVRTGILIHEISPSDLTMSFSVNLMNELSSTFIGGNGASGNMFDVFAAKDVNIRKMYLNVAMEESINVELWMRTGTHVDYEYKPWLWQRMAVARVEGNGRGKKSCMEIGSLTLNANTRYGFYIVAPTGKFRYTNGNGVGEISASNEDLTIYEGAGLSRPFTRVYNNRIWNGDLFYDVLSQNDNQSTGGRRLETTFDGGSGQDGIMFDVLPKHSLRIKGLDLHLADTNETSVQIYTKEGSFSGFENQRDEWALVAKLNVFGKGLNVATKAVLKGGNMIHLKKGILQAFYIVVDQGRGLRYTQGNGVGMPVSSNENLAVFEGVGVSSEFGSLFPDRVWNGALHYEVDSI